ncbi:cytosolic carboxypeptidase Nna1 isoform X12 [Drosophila eugracilis]|uniref:cytosolic carboxypeptidase Nna1 isoform X12 n=1 Tax=Drosophila eugracilis TaxID=29029 RepID=UPI0007E6CA31|nr:cytosolic carboxypeptidase Nna1 isoform X12 [Drosophila eugracilis]
MTEREVVTTSISRLLRTLSSASMSRRRCPLALLQPMPVRQNEIELAVESVECVERCCSSCSDESNNNGRSKSEERETETELEAGDVGDEEDEEEEKGKLEAKSKEEKEEVDELEMKRDSTVNVNVVRANFKCNDMECSLVLGDYVNGFLGSFLSKGLKTNQLVVNTDEKTLRPVARLKEPRDLFALPKDKDNDCSQQAPRWPVECQVIEERITHIPYVPATPEPLNAPTGNELKPRPVGEESGIVVFSYSPISAVNYFSRSAVGGARFVTNCHPMNPEEYDGLEFESRFESGNLAKAVQITPTFYELYLRPDLYTSRSKQWFYFRVRHTRRKMFYRFSIVNLVKSDSLYNDGMQPVMYSTLGAKEKSEGWRRCGDNICYYRNDDESASNSANEDDEDNSTYTLTFTIEFEHDDDTVFFAHSYPYTYSDLQDYLMEIQRHPVKSKFCKLRLLCRTLAGNNVYYLTVTAPSANEENMRRKKSIVVSARVHPSETPASWMMKGLMDFITGDTTVAKRLRHKFIFKLVPMLNPDGVIVGNTRNSLTGKDLNRQYRTVIRETYPSIWYTKAMIRRLIEECGVAMYCDMHAHSRKHNIFIYGCENKRNPEKKLTEQVFPLMLHKNSADRFSFESCKFKIQRSKEGTGRIVVWMLGITNSYTIEASFGGSSLGSRKGTHFNTQDYEHMGRAFCETLLDYCDENPNKVKRHAKLFKQIKKIRKREKREQKALKLQKMADQGCIMNDKLKVKRSVEKSVS